MKNKLKLIILLIPLIILSTGCTATYKMEITDEQIKESLNIEETFDQTVKNAYFNEKNTLEGYGYNTTYYNNYITKMEEKYKGYYINRDNFNRDNYEIINRLYDSGYRYYLEMMKNMLKRIIP